MRYALIYLGSLTAIYTPSNTAPLDKTMRMALSYKGAFNS